MDTEEEDDEEKDVVKPLVETEQSIGLVTEPPYTPCERWCLRASGDDGLRICSEAGAACGTDRDPSARGRSQMEGARDQPGVDQGVRAHLQRAHRAQPARVPQHRRAGGGVHGAERRLVSGKAWGSGSHC